MSALPLRIGYGPPGALEHRAALGRSTAAFGLGVATGVVFGVPATVALDSGRTLEQWFPTAAAAIGAGLVVAVLLARAAANLGARIGSTVALASGVSAIAWLALFNTGEAAAVEALVLVGLATSVPVVTLGAIDAAALNPAGKPLAAVGHPVASWLAGVSLGAAVMFLDPTLVWSDVGAVGGALALLGASTRLAQADRALGAPPAPPPGELDRSPTDLRVLLAATLGPVAAPVLRLDDYLAEQWQAGVRYSLLTLALAGLVGAAGIVGLLWLPARARRSAPAELDDAARASLIAAATLMLVAISQTLPGTVAGGAIAAGVSAAAIVSLAATGLRGAPARAGVQGAVPVLVAGATWTLTWWAWPTLVDAAGSQRVAVALCAVPALAVAGMVGLRPLSAQRSESITLTPSSPTGQVANTAAPDEVDVANVINLAPATGNGSGPHHRALLEARGIEFSYGAVQVLFGVDLEVHQGEVVALLGTNGAGKTTFLRTVAGLEVPTAGRMRFAGGDLSRFSAPDRVLLGINQIAAGAAVAPDLTVEENLAMFGHTLRPGDARAGAALALEAFPRLAERRTQNASALSGGERQMLALSKSLVLRPRLLVIDECTLGLAPVAVAALVPVIRRLHEEGASVLLVEQSIHLALDLADRAVCMEKGRIVHESSAQALREDPGLIEAVYLEGIAAAMERRDPGAA